MVLLVLVLTQIFIQETALTESVPAPGWRVTASLGSEHGRGVSRTPDGRYQISVLSIGLVGVPAPACIGAARRSCTGVHRSSSVSAVVAPFCARVRGALEGSGAVELLFQRVARARKPCEGPGRVTTRTVREVQYESRKKTEQSHRNASPNHEYEGYKLKR